MSANVLVMPMTMADLDPVIDIVNASFTSPWSKAWMAGALQNRDDCFFSVSKLPDTQQITGFAVYSFVIDQAHVMNIGVDPAFRKQGIGAALLQAIIAEVDAKNGIQITLEVRKSNVAALALYQAHKFDVIGTRPRYYKDGEDAYIMLRES